MAGDWKAYLAGTSRFYGPRAVVEDAMGGLVCEVPSDPGQDPMPRARLVAAAPDLLAALETTLDALEAFTTGRMNYGTTVPEREAMARAAIAKAKGA